MTGRCSDASGGVPLAFGAGSGEGQVHTGPEGFGAGGSPRQRPADRLLFSNSQCASIALVRAKMASHCGFQDAQELLNLNLVLEVVSQRRG